MSKTPPLPPDQRSRHAPQGDVRPDLRARGDGQPGRDKTDPDHRGDGANIRQNTSRSGNVQDR